MSFPLFCLLNSTNRKSALVHSDGSRTHFNKLLLLNVLTFLLRELTTSCTTNFDSLRKIAIKGRAAVREMEEKAAGKHLTMSIEQSAAVLNNTQLLVSVIEQIVLSVRASSLAHGKQQMPSALKLYLTSLCYSNESVLALVSRNLAYDQRAWDLHRDRLNVIESESVTRLTMLAAIFSPSRCLRAFCL